MGHEWIHNGASCIALHPHIQFHLAQVHLLKPCSRVISFSQHIAYNLETVQHPFIEFHPMQGRLPKLYRRVLSFSQHIPYHLVIMSNQRTLYIPGKPCSILELLSWLVDLNKGLDFRVLTIFDETTSLVYNWISAILLIFLGKRSTPCLTISYIL